MEGNVGINRVFICGRVTSGPVFSHRVFGTNFYSMEVSSRRLRGTQDRIQVMVREDLMDKPEEYTGKVVRIFGSFRSFDRKERTYPRTILSVYAREMRVVEEKNYVPRCSIHLNGFICKEPTYRKTPLGREITDVLLAVNRPNGSTDYIPCISWEKDAFHLSGYHTGDRIELQGRIQSRDYIKKTDEGEEIRTTYEVSVFRLITEEEEEQPA